MLNLAWDEINHDMRKVEFPFQAYTDYPFEELGDTLNAPAPTRECMVTSYDGDKYCNIKIETAQGVKRYWIKRGYIYHANGEVVKC